MHDLIAAFDELAPQDTKQGIFISYRRGDSQETTGRMGDHLKAELGADTVFQDVHTIPAGENFLD